jgi:isopentenyl-diphosphate delta-isomerase
MSEDRKKDHIELALKSQTKTPEVDFEYEPLFSPHPDSVTEDSLATNFLGMTLKSPLWVSSMTGGTEKAFLLNKNLATVAGEFGFGMGLGSCRSLLDSSDRLADFDFKETIGNYPFYINLGIAQLEELVQQGLTSKIGQLITKLSADGLIIHVNPMQEWFQPEGDRYKLAPIDTIKNIVNTVETKIIVKEVGQGFGPRSLKSLMSLPLAAIELSGFGGTNFSLLELSRHNAQKFDNESSKSKLVNTGHTASQMIGWINEYTSDPSFDHNCDDFIISGGVKCLLDGLKLQNELQAKSVIGMASGLLKHAHDLSQLRDYIFSELESYKFAKAYLK